MTALIGSPPGKTKLNAIEEEPEEIKTLKVINEGTGPVEPRENECVSSFIFSHKSV